MSTPGYEAKFWRLGQNVHYSLDEGGLRVDVSFSGDLNRSTSTPDEITVVRERPSAGNLRPAAKPGEIKLNVEILLRISGRKLATDSGLRFAPQRSIPSIHRDYLDS